MSKLNWNNLKEMKCPECSNKLRDGVLGYKCDGCGFRILYDRFKQVINDMYKPEPNSLKALNNL